MTELLLEIKVTDEDPAKPGGQRGTIQVWSTLRFNYRYLINHDLSPKSKQTLSRPTGFVHVMVVLKYDTGQSF